MSCDYTLLTGATGFIGQYLLCNLLNGGRQVAVLVRAKNGVPPAERMEGILQLWEDRLQMELPRPICLEGDIRHELFGLDADDISWIRQNADTMVHNAALVEFVSRGSTIWDTNVLGTENCLELCQAGRVPNLHYVSTAYVCGNRSGRIYETDLDCGQAFRNEYEKSKFVSEQMVRSSTIPDQLTIYRPSVVIGDSVDGFATSFRGMYILAQFTQLVAEHAEKDGDGRWHHPVRLDKAGSEKRNLVPVDWVAQVISRVVQQPQLQGCTYHIAPEKPVSAAEIEAAFRQYFNFYGVDLLGPRVTQVARRSEMEELFYSYIARYLPYWDCDPEFDVTNARAAMLPQKQPVVDSASLIRMIDFAVRQRFGKLRVAGSPLQHAV